MKMVRLYNDNFTERLIKTQYGEVSYLDWLVREKDRIERDPNRTAEVRTRRDLNGEVAGLFVNTPVRGCDCPYCAIKRVHRKNEKGGKS